MEIDTKASSKIPWSMERGLRSSPLKIFTKAHILKENRMATVNTIGRMEVSTKEVLWEAIVKETRYGRNILEIVINTKANTWGIKSKATEFSLGLVEIFIKETMKMMKEKDMERCIGQTAAIIKALG